MAAYVAVDIGTTHVKAVAVTDTGALAQTDAPTPWEMQNSRRILNPKVLLRVILVAVREALDRLGEVDYVISVAVTSMGEAGLYVSETEPLGFIGAWQDLQETQREYADLLSSWDPQGLFEMTGVAPSPKFGLFRMRAQHLPGSKGYWLSVADFLVWHLTGGIRVTHASLAARTMAYDWQSGDWNQTLLNWASLDPEQMPRIVTAPCSVGRVIQTDDVRLKGAAVIHAGHDHICAAYGADLQIGELLDSTGTAEPLLVRDKNPLLSIAARKNHMSWGMSLFGDKTHIGLLPTPGGGAAEVWARQVLGLEWSEITDLAEFRQTTVGFDPRQWASDDAMWQGLGFATGRLDLYWAVLNGVAESLAERIETVEYLMNRRYNRLKVVGGIARHKPWLAIRARHLKRTQLLMQPGNGAVIGAIRYAAEALGRPVPIAVKWIPWDSTSLKKIGDTLPK